MKLENLNYNQTKSFYKFAIWLEGGFTESNTLWNQYYWWSQDRDLKPLEYKDWLKVMRKHFYSYYKGKGKDKTLYFLCTHNLLDESEAFETCLMHQANNPLKLKSPLFNFVSQIHFVDERVISFDLQLFRKLFATPRKVK